MTPDTPSPRKESGGTIKRVGPMCHCGHGMYEHYMCGAPDSMWCYYGKSCGCKQFSDHAMTRKSNVR